MHGVILAKMTSFSINGVYPLRTEPSARICEGSSRPLSSSTADMGTKLTSVWSGRGRSTGILGFSLQTSPSVVLTHPFGSFLSIFSAMIRVALWTEDIPTQKFPKLDTNLG